MGMRLLQGVREGEGGPRKFFGEGTCVIESAGGHGDLGSATRDERLHDLAADLTRAEDEDPRIGQLSEDPARQLHRDISQAHLPLRDSRMGASPSARLEGALEDTIQHRARHPARKRISVSVLGLPRDFGFADHLGIQTGDDREQMLDGLKAGNRAQVPI